MTNKHTPDAAWVLNYMNAVEDTGRHAPVETMQRVADSQAELLAALERVVDCDELPTGAEYLVWVANARAAIAKAKG